jgi:L-amino acid N-acyltransferase YncA
MAMMQFTIRAAHLSDAGSIAAIYRPLVECTAISFEEAAPDGPEMARRLAEITRHYPWLVAQQDGALLGYAYANRHRERAGYRYSVDVSVYVAQDARGKGIGSALYGALFKELRTQDFHRAFAGIALPNDASVALHHRFGFEPVGVYKEVGFKFGKWLDVYWCQRSI